MSFGGGANQAIDDSVRNLISSGVTSVVAAGNNNADANGASPARVRQAITVGAVDINDNRASFSNFGNAVDIFAPGVNITSAWWNGGFAQLSGTSMVAPHVAGVVAQILQTNSNSSLTPEQIEEAVVSKASWDKVLNRGTGSPNTLIFSGDLLINSVLKPLYRYYDTSLGGHFYTARWSQIGAGLGSNNVEKIEARVYSSNISGTIPQILGF